MAAKITPREVLIRANANYDAFGDTATMLATDPRLTGEERQALIKARDIAVKRRLRDEHPVLSRFVDYVEGRGEPLATKKDWQTLVTLLGPQLSEAEKDAIDMLAKKELFAPEIRDRFFSSFRDQHQEMRVGHVKSVGVKTGVGRVSTIVANMGLAIGTSMVFPPALLAVIPLQIIGQRKIDTAITNAKADALGAYGVNRFKGDEVEDEARLVLSHLSKGTGLDVTTPASLADAAEGDVALIRNLQTARTAAPADDSPEAKRLESAVDAYASKLETLLAAHAKKPKTAGELRQAIWDARAEALAPDVVRAAMVTTVRASARPMWPELELAFADVQEQAMNVAAGALAPGGLAGAEQRASLEADAAAYLRTVEAIKDRAPNLVNEQLKAFFTEAYSNPTTVLGSDAAKKLSSKLEDVRSDVAKVRTDLEAQLKPVSKSDAEGIARDVAQTVFDQVLPRFLGKSDKTKLEVTGAKQREDGGYDVSLAFKRGLFGSSGSFSVSIARDGLADASSIQIRVDPDRASEVARTAVEAYDRAFNGGSADVAVGALRNPGRKDSDPFELGGSLADGAKRFKIRVTADGLPDRASLAIS